MVRGRLIDFFRSKKGQIGEHWTRLNDAPIIVALRSIPRAQVARTRE